MAAKAKKKGGKGKAGPANKMIALPSGFKSIERIGSFWRGDSRGDALTGKMLGVKLKHFDKKGSYAARDVNVYTIQTLDGKKVEVTQSGGLGALELVKKGQSVHIVFLGMKNLKGKSPMREYAVGVK